MKVKQYISKCFSLFLIILLLQKSGGGLVLHEWLHIQNNPCVSHEHPEVVASVPNCNCIDDYYMPFAEPPATIVQPVLPSKKEFVAIPQLPIPFSLTFFHSLRGPPFSIA
jgi:hypothetical protein